MNPRIQQIWVDALRSGVFEQGRRMLNSGGQFCCLGVLCEIAVHEGVIPAPTQVPGFSILGPRMGYGQYDAIACLPLEVQEHRVSCLALFLAADGVL